MLSPVDQAAAADTHDEALAWEELPTRRGPYELLPFRVKLRQTQPQPHTQPSDHSPQPRADRNITLTALTPRVCLRESFDHHSYGLWQTACGGMLGHYEHGFDAECRAPRSSHSLFLKGGNEANFGMTLKLPSFCHNDAARPASGRVATAAVAQPPAVPAPDWFGVEQPPQLSELARGLDADEATLAHTFDGAFRPDLVSFYVRTDDTAADAGHFILGESNEVNKRVAQFQFTKEGTMGLLGTGGITHGAMSYEANRWYQIELRFDWEDKTVAFSVDGALQQSEVPFRRDTSAFIGACALGNRDKCTTWFDRIEFVQEIIRFETSVPIRDGVAEAWIGPLNGAACSREGFVLRAVDCSSGASGTAGPFYPLSKTEGAHRVSINSSALSDFQALLHDAATSDVAFVVEGADLPAHRCILSARCEAFRAMFNSPCREGSTTCADCLRVPVHDVTRDAFFCMLSYIYGGSVDVPAELAIEVLGLADRYLLPGLKLLCGFSLRRMVSIDSVVRILLAAERWDAPLSDLHAHCMDFLLAHFDEVVHSSTFDELASSPQLLLQVTRAAARIVASSGSTSTRRRAASPNEATLMVKRRRTDGPVSLTSTSSEL